MTGTGTGQYRAPLDSLADLTVSLALSDTNPVAGETITLTASIANLGGTAAQNVLVRFYDGDPSYGIQLGSDQVLSDLPAAANAVLTANRELSCRGEDIRSRQRSLDNG